MEQGSNKESWNVEAVLRQHQYHTGSRNRNGELYKPPPIETSSIWNIQISSGYYFLDIVILIDWLMKGEYPAQISEWEMLSVGPTLSGIFLLSIRGKTRSWSSCLDARLLLQPYMKTLFLRLCPWKSQYSKISRSSRTLGRKDTRNQGYRWQINT